MRPFPTLAFNINKRIVGGIVLYRFLIWPSIWQVALGNREHIKEWKSSLGITTRLNFVGWMANSIDSNQAASVSLGIIQFGPAVFALAFTDNLLFATFYTSKIRSILVNFRTSRNKALLLVLGFLTGESVCFNTNQCLFACKANQWISPNSVRLHYFLFFPFQSHLIRSDRLLCQPLYLNNFQW